MSQILTLALPFFGLIFLGFFAGKWFPQDEAIGWLNRFVLYFALPAMFFRIISQTPVEQIANPTFVVATVSASLIAFLLAMLAGVALTRGGLAQAAIQGGAGGYGNVGYMGPGLTLATFGQAATVPTALVFTFDSILFFALIPLIMAVAGNQEGGLVRAAGTILWRIVTQPFIIAIALGVAAAYAQFETPEALGALLDMLKGAAAPCALFAIGVTVAQRPLGRVPLDLPVLVAIKLAIHPAIVLALLILLGPFDPLWVKTAVLLAGLPTAVSVFVLAQEYHVYVQRASSAILVSTGLSVATVSILLYLVTSDMIPTALP